MKPEKADDMFLRREEGETIEDFINREHQHSRRILAMEARITRQMSRQFSQENQILLEKIQIENQAVWERMQNELHGIRHILGSMNRKLDKLNSMDEKLDTMNGKLDTMNGKLDKLDSIDQKLIDGPRPGSNGHGKSPDEIEPETG